MAIIGLSLDDTIDWTLPWDTEDPTTWELGMIDPTTIAKIKDATTKFNLKQGEEGVGTTLNINQQSLEYVRFGLKSFSNFKNDKGEDIPCQNTSKRMGGGEYKILSDKTLNQIPMRAILAIAEQLKKLNHVDEEQEGNSD